MKKTNINSLQVSSLILCLIISASMGMGIFNALEIARIDSYIAVIISSIIGTFPLGLTLYIASYKPKLNIIEKIDNLFGKYLGFIINKVISIIVLIISFTTIFSISNFIVSQFLSNTPVIYIGLMFAILSIFALNKGIETISRSSLIMIFITIIFFVLLATSLLTEFKVSNLKPILEFGLNKPIFAGFTTMLINIVPIFCILIIPKDNIVDKKNYNKFMTIAYLIGISIVIIMATVTIGVLGQYLANIYQYPEYIVLKKITLFNFIDRIENIICIQWIASTFITIVLCFYYITNSIKKNDKPKKLGIEVVALAIILSLYVFKNNTTFNLYIIHVYPYILALMLLLFTIIAIAIFWKKKMTTNQQ